MSFILGNHTIDEILEAVSTSFDGTEFYYSVDQLQNASIAITSDPREITDKKGNIVRRIYTSKNGEFNATNAFLHPALMNAASGSDIEKASSTKKIDMPKIEIVAPGTVINDDTTDFSDAKVVGIYGNGANSEPLTKSTSAASFDDGTYKVADGKLTVPATGSTTGVDYPTSYLVMYTREVESGIKLSNLADKFPSACKLTLYVSYVDPCKEELRPAYVVIPNFMPDPAMTLNLSSENQEVDFNGTLQVDYCGEGGKKVLYYIYYPDENIVESGESDQGE